MWVKLVLRMLSRWPSFGGCSLSIDWVSPTAIEAMAALVSDTGPPSPIFSPAAGQSMPAAVSRAPIAGSPGHWCERPQPSAISRLCADEVVSRPVVMVSAGSPAVARAWLMSASTWAAGAPSWSAVALLVGEATAEAVADALGADELTAADADGDGAILVRCGLAAA